MAKPPIKTLKHGQKAFDAKQPTQSATKDTGVTEKGVEEVKTLRKKSPKAAPVETPPEPGRVNVLSSFDDKELGYYVPYEYPINDKPFTFYKAFIHFNGAPVCISENYTASDYAAKQIVREFNKRHGTRHTRKQSKDTPSSTAQQATS